VTTPPHAVRFSTALRRRGRTKADALGNAQRRRPGWAPSVRVAVLRVRAR